MTRSDPPRYPRVVLATGNPHKLGEVRAILAVTAPGVEVVAYDGPSPEEDGDTFTANALIKARAAAAATGLPTIADDSGIGAVALGGEPGIRSARFAGTGLDADNRALLLERLRHAADRRAEFTCAAVLVAPSAPPVVAVATWSGVLLDAERGAGGFGYDPLFVPDGGDGRTAAQFTPEEKDATSHRGRAFRALAALAFTG